MLTCWFHTYSNRLNSFFLSMAWLEHPWILEFCLRRMWSESFASDFLYCWDLAWVFGREPMGLKWKEHRCRVLASVLRTFERWSAMESKWKFCLCNTPAILHNLRTSYFAKRIRSLKTNLESLHHLPKMWVLRNAYCLLKDGHARRPVICGLDLHA